MLKIRKYFIPVVCLMIFMITIVCSSFSTELLINGDAAIRTDYNIRITGVNYTVTNGAYETYNNRFSQNSTLFSISLPNLNSTITYAITITNKTPDVYIISELTNSFVNEYIECVYDDFLVGQELLPAQATTIHITFKYKSTVTRVPDDDFDVVSSLYAFDNPMAYMLGYHNKNTACDNVQCALDELFKFYKKV